VAYGDPLSYAFEAELLVDDQVRNAYLGED